MSLWPLFNRGRRDRELDEEIRAHLAMATSDRVERGEDSQAAELAARREFGNVALIHETTRDMWGWSSLERLWLDARYALRGMRRSPGFTAVAVLSLALGIGANTAIFSLINTLMLRALPVQHPEQLVEPLHRFQDEPHFNSFSWQTYQYFLDHNHVFSGLIATHGVNHNYGSFFNVCNDDLAVERVDGVCVTGNFFPVLGVKPVLGRLIGPDDNRLDTPASVAVVSWSYWKNRFNLDRAILGKRIVVDGVPVTSVASGRERLVIHVVPDARVLLFTAGLALLTGLLFGMAPALRAWGTAPASSLRDPGRGGDTRFRRLFAKSLVAAQVALSVGLLSAAGLFIRYLSNIYAGLGFQRDHVLLVTLNTSRSGYSRAQLARPYQELLERLQAIPAVRSATLSGVTPTQGAGANRDATVEGYQYKPGELRYLAENWVGPKYFETFGTPLLRGRGFTFEDQGRPRVAIVNETMARRYFGDGDPIGKHITFDGETAPYEIVGVVGDAKYINARESAGPIIYFHAFQEGHIFSQFSLRTRGAPAAVAADVRRTVNQVLKNVTVERITTLADQVDATIVPERLIVTLAGMFGALGALIAAIGTYGLLAYSVAHRINEIGIRMAMGATQTRISRMVLGEALGITCGGLLIGVPVAYWAKRLAAGLIPDLPVRSESPIALGAALMIAIALVAATVPARRAARVDPMEALRYE
jgi:hypothetical protein